MIWNIFHCLQLLFCSNDPLHFINPTELNIVSEPENAKLDWVNKSDIASLIFLFFIPLFPYPYF